MSPADLNLLGINVHSPVYFKLTSAGKAYYYDLMHKMNEEFISKGMDVRYRTHLDENEHGYSDLHLWSFIEYFGPTFHASATPINQGGMLYFSPSNLITPAGNRVFVLPSAEGGQE